MATTINIDLSTVTNLDEYDEYVRNVYDSVGLSDLLNDEEVLLTVGDTDYKCRKKLPHEGKNTSYIKPGTGEEITIVYRTGDKTKSVEYYNEYRKKRYKEVYTSLTTEQKAGKTKNGRIDEIIRILKTNRDLLIEDAIINDELYKLINVLEVSRCSTREIEGTILYQDTCTMYPITFNKIVGHYGEGFNLYIRQSAIDKLNGEGFNIENLLNKYIGLTEFGKTKEEHKCDRNVSARRKLDAKIEEYLNILDKSNGILPPLIAIRNIIGNDPLDFTSPNITIYSGILVPSDKANDFDIQIEKLKNALRKNGIEVSKFFKEILKFIPIRVPNAPTSESEILAYEQKCFDEYEEYDINKPEVKLHDTPAQNVPLLGRFAGRYIDADRKAYPHENLSWDFGDPDWTTETAHSEFSGLHTHFENYKNKKLRHKRRLVSKKTSIYDINPDRKATLMGRLLDSWNSKELAQALYNDKVIDDPQYIRAEKANAVTKFVSTGLVSAGLFALTSVTIPQALIAWGGMQLGWTLIHKIRKTKDWIIKIRKDELKGYFHKISEQFNMARNAYAELSRAGDFIDETRKNQLKDTIQNAKNIINEYKGKYLKKANTILMTYFDTHGSEAHYVRNNIDEMDLVTNEINSMTL